MEQIEPLVHLNYKVDKDILLLESDRARKFAKEYTDSRYPEVEIDNWKRSKHTSDYIKKIIDDFDVVGNPGFYYLEPNANIITHTDNGALCAISFLLSENNSALTINDKDYHYESALLDTTLPHGLKKNGSTERVQFKISIKNENFLSVYNKLRNKNYIN
jgi:hypothetical protein